MHAPIATARLHLRPFRPDDAARLLVLSHETGLRRWMPDQVYRDEAHAERVARALALHTDAPPAPHERPFVLGVELRETGSLIGHVGLSPARGSVEIGYAIEDRLAGRGLATEAVSAMTEWALGELAIAEVLGIVDADNAASCRVLEKARFVHVADDGVAIDGIVRVRRIYRRGR